MLKADGLMKSYENQYVLKRIDVLVTPGQILGILGPNGCGKSTLLKLLAGIEKPDEGEVWLNGFPICKYPIKERAKQIAVLPQGGIEPLPLSVEDYILMGREPYQSWWPWYHQADRKFVNHWMERMGLTSYRSRSLSQLSGGERQRVGISKAMVQEPNFLLLDEPLNHLDLKYQLFILALLKQLSSEQQIGIVIVLHDVNLAAQYCDLLLFLESGSCIAFGMPKEVINQTILNQVYGVNPMIINHPQISIPQILYPHLVRSE